MFDLWTALYHGVIYALLAGAVLVLAYLVLDLLTPGHLGRHLLGGEDHEASYSAATVTAAWMVGNAAVIFTAIWTNGDTDLGYALLWTLVFGLVGCALNSVMLVAVDLVTPGNLRAVVCTPGRVVPLAVVSAAATLAISAIVCASIA
ncbi:protein of unknown function [Nocardioides scoriae]|uniref:DUF350 domain-containing protein n=1 Tax=Nocardioides scoriae TaxID=642780 RepID=A0A1H1XQY8_9ACTN|nr:DUF350 domain-containing protein [Nocardioides scoriae]SDT11684.1 protein of unknown function [Nocardioides scoriae]